MPRVMKVFWVVWVVFWFAIVVRTLLACDPPKNPVPCTGGEVWPDPCAGVKLDATPG